MSTGLIQLILVLIPVITYLLWRMRQPVAGTGAQVPRLAPQPKGAPAPEVPSGYCFHPAHTWVANEGGETARVGIDSFAANLLGNVEKIEIIGEQRWVRQGQKLMTIAWDGETVEMLSPLEGVVTAINPAVIHDPGLIARSPYTDGWVCVIRSPDMAADVHNLVQGVMVRPWMRNNFDRVNRAVAQAGSSATEDGGAPASGLLARLSPDVRKRIVSEFLVT